WATKTSGGYGGVFVIIGLALLVFPRLALGLSGFETGVAVMPLVKSPNRIENTRKLLMTAALIMSFMLIASSFVTSVLIPEKEFCPVVDCKLAEQAHSTLEACSCLPEEVASGAVKEAG